MDKRTEQFEINVAETVADLLGIYNHELSQIEIDCEANVSTFEDVASHHLDVEIEFNYIRIEHTERSDVYHYDEEQLKRFIKQYYKDQIEEKLNNDPY